MGLRKNYGVSRGEAVSTSQPVVPHEKPLPFWTPLGTGVGLYVGATGVWGLFLTLFSAPLYLLDLLIWITVCPALAVLWAWEYSRLYGVYASLSEKLTLIVAISLIGALVRIVLNTSFASLSLPLYWATQVGLTVVSTAILLICCYWVDLFIYKDLPDSDTFDF